MRNLKLIVVIVIFIVLIAVFLAKMGFLNPGRGNIDKYRDSSLNSKNPASPAFVGGRVCAECHKAEYDLWSGSHHDLAMQNASDVTVLGDFGNKELDYYGLKSEFYKSDGKFMVRTDGPDGKLHDYKIKYTFGVYPLQQYLIEFPNGRLQALGIAWDSRPSEEGGQRWFHLYPNEKITHNDTLHWTGIDQNWNFMCAECHSTNLRKNYDLKTNSFNTSWSEINVSCEACHGPGSEHVEWARQKNKDEFPNKGLLVNFNYRKGISWIFDEESGTVVRSKPLETHTEIKVCSRCHSRRSAISDNYVYGRDLLDTHIPSLLDEGIYYPDGQIEAEDYEWGSFIQSKMYQNGVTCTDCHDPHSLMLRAEGNTLCTSCHMAKKYDSPSHHHHKPLSAGSRCVACHMPQTNYMVIDARRDHSIRIPRPDLTIKIGSPNACNKCHTDRSAEWAASDIKTWKSGNYKGFQNYGETLFAARNGLVRAEELLVKLADDENAPSIARATALKELDEYLSPSSLGAVKMGMKNFDPLIRMGALEAIQGAPPDVKLRLGFGMLNDPVLGVRMKAASLLAGVPNENMTAGQIKSLEDAIKEYVSSQMTNADRPEAHTNVGLIYAERGTYSEAEVEYKIAMKLEPSFIPAYVNLADLYRMEGKDKEGEELLRKAIVISPENGDVYHALGLLLVRQNRISDAINAFERSIKLSPNNMHYSYVYAVALNDTGRKSDSIRVLEEAYKRRPADREILYALVIFNRESGNISEALEYAEKLIEISPEDPNAVRLLSELKGEYNR